MSTKHSILHITIRNIMGYGIDFTADIFLSRVTINNEYELDAIIEETEESIATTKTSLSMLAASNIRDVTPKEWYEEPIRWVQRQVDDLLQVLSDDIQFLQNLRYYKEYLDAQNH